jgi:DNA polymerase delta subunit 1
MQAWNLCYSTLVSPMDVNRVDPELYKKSENGHCFVHSNVRKGILPTILEELLSGKDMGMETEKFCDNDFGTSSKL